MPRIRMSRDHFLNNVLRVEIVTPIRSDEFLDRILCRDPSLDHLCLELIHWGYPSALDWVKKATSHRQNGKVCCPAISVHGYHGDLSFEMRQAIVDSGALWMPRAGLSMGKDCGTIIRESQPQNTLKLVGVDNTHLQNVRMIGPKTKYDHDLETYNSLDLWPPGGTHISMIEDSEFEEMLRQAARELNNE